MHGGTLAVALAASAIVLVMALTLPHMKPAHRVQPHQAAMYDPQLAPQYAEWAAQGPRGNQGYETRLAYLQPGTNEAPQTRDQALAERSALRAYAGAPPTIPHRVDGHNYPNCLACHEQGIQVADRRAAKISHPHLANCLQCHVPQQIDLPDPPDWPNTFIGSRETTLSPAWEGAPPQTPHSVWMRQDCLSCHGAQGEVGLRTSHPERRNCLQCHAPAADAQRVLPWVQIQEVAGYVEGHNGLSP